MTPAVLTALLPGAADAELEDWGSLDEATAHPMAVHGVEIWVDGATSAGIWQCSPGPSFFRQAENEVIYVLSGRMTVTPDGGDPRDIGAGDVAVFPLGWAGSWDIHETLRKVYVVF
ncbi:cupin domain-containing protein [Mycobacterium sp. Y57]|uniref:cupin domain-containing protein n=1 Tax=Mycolicibacterium xanthum TaxID=2796469 RepID=UPI001C858F5C|nr:cupin domain-containing protein [Mycolicibacterium xanthum]MBX7431988.1 cupin domain-containing protein [Mycolicibacterium xanthum]